MAYTIEINGTDETASLREGSLSVILGSENSECYLELNSTADILGTTDGTIVGQDIKIKDSGTSIFGGVIKAVRINRYKPEIGTDTELVLSLTCNDYNDILSRRVTTLTTTNKTAGEIATLVLAELNLTGYSDNVGTGTISDGASYISYSAIAKSCKDIMDELATASGFKWYVDANKDLYFVEEDTITDAPYDLVTTSPTFTDFNILALEISLENYRNKQWVLGGEDTDGVQLVYYSQDLTEMADRAAIESNSGVYGNIITATDVQTDTDAVNIATNGLKVYGKIPYTLTFTTFTNDFLPNTKLKANLPVLGISEDMYFLIENVELTDIGNVLKSTITATRRDETNFSTQKTEDYKDYFAKLLQNGTSTELGSSSVVSDIDYVTNSNDAIVELTTAEIVVCTYDVVITSRSKLLIYFDATVDPDAALTTTATVYVNSVARPKTPKTYMATTNPYNLSLHDEKMGVETGTVTVYVALKTDTSTASIEASQAKLTIEILPDSLPADVTNFNVVATGSTTTTSTWTNP